MSLGMVMQLPDAADEHSISQQQLIAKLDVAMGGRVAEELIFGERDVTTGASSDLEQVRGFRVEGASSDLEQVCRSFCSPQHAACADSAPACAPVGHERSARNGLQVRHVRVHWQGVPQL